MTTVINIKSGHRYDVYIGRANRELGLPESSYHNPHPIPHINGYRTTARLESIRRFRLHLSDHPELVARIRVELKDKVLGCYCYPQPCHGDVLARIANGGEI